MATRTREVFTLDEIESVIEEHGMPDEEDPNNIEHGNRIIEAQIWDLEKLQQQYHENLDNHAAT